jgi:hypothetical protein
VKSILRRRPSPALAISCVALFLSLGGVSYGLATGSIDSREIKDSTVRSKDVRNDTLRSNDLRNNTVRSSDLRNNSLRTFDIRNNEVRGFDIRNSSVQGRDVAFDTLTGADVSEPSLDKVPSAAAADTAASAGNAATVGGMSVRKIFVKQAVGTAVAEIFRGDGFALEAGCPAAEAVLQLDGIAGGPETSATWRVTNPSDESDFVSDADLAAGDDHSLIDTDQAPAGMPVNAARGLATVTVSTTGGGVATVQIAAHESPAFQGESVCAFRGTVVSG